MTRFADELRRMDACAEAVKWVGNRTLEQAWAECERADWMLWLYAHRKPNKRVCVTLALEFTKHIPHLSDRTESKAAIDAARGWLAGTVSAATCRDAGCAADSAAAASVAFAASAAASTSSAAGYAAAGHAAAAAYWAFYAADLHAAKDAVSPTINHKALAAIVRQHISVEDVR